MSWPSAASSCLPRFCHGQSWSPIRVTECREGGHWNDVQGYFGCATEIQGYSNKKYCARGQEQQTQVPSSQRMHIQVDALSCIYNLHKSIFKNHPFVNSGSYSGKEQTWFTVVTMQMIAYFLVCLCNLFGNISAWCTNQMLVLSHVCECGEQTR